MKAQSGGGEAIDLAQDLTAALPAAGVSGRPSGVNWIGTVGLQFPFNERSAPYALTGKSIRLTTGPDVPAGDYLSIQIEYYPVAGDGAERFTRGIASLLFLFAIAIVGVRWLGPLPAPERSRSSQAPCRSSQATSCNSNPVPPFRTRTGRLIEPGAASSTKSGVTRCRPLCSGSRGPEY